MSMNKVESLRTKLHDMVRLTNMWLTNSSGAAEISFQREQGYDGKVKQVG